MEMFSLIYPETNGTRRIQACVQYLDFFPLFRFCQMLGRGPSPIIIRGNMVTVELKDLKPSEDEVLFTSRFRNVKRLIEMHWLDGLPLWPCLMGISEVVDEESEQDEEESQYSYEDDKDKDSIESDYSERYEATPNAAEYKQITENEKEAQFKENEDNYDCSGPFGDFMYSVRQIVALYRIDIAGWRSRSIKHLRSWELLERGQSETEWDELSNPQLVEQVIEMLSGAIEYRLSYAGSFSDVGRGGKKWGTNRNNACFVTEDKVAGEKEHGVVRVVDKYRAEVDQMLRKRLGDEYEEWEKLSEEEFIPQGVIL